MNTFIHTFSLSVNITADECKKLYLYKWMPLNNTYKGKKYISAIIEFCSCGLQILLRECHDEEIRYDKKHCPYRMEIVVTPYKLLYPDKCLGAIVGVNDLQKALIRLRDLLENIETDTKISIIKRFRIERVDITCDVITPSDEYSHEIIALLKTADLQYGYKKLEPTELDVKKYGWNQENAYLFYNRNQGVFVKIYNKKENIRGTSEYQELKNKGLLRYEIELTRKYLKKKDFLYEDNLSACLMAIMEHSKELMKQHIISNMYDLPILSQKVLNDYLEIKYGKKEKTYSKLKNFCKMAYKCKLHNKEFSATQCKMSEKVFDNCFRKFEKIGVSPVPADDICPYIPSVTYMLDGLTENRFLYFAEKQTRGKELWLYE